MMDTILNVGIDHTTTDLWLEKLGPKCFGDSLHRLVVMYGSVVKGISRQALEPNLQTALAVYASETGETFPTASAQLLGAIEAVFKSWDNDRAVTYRKLNKIPREWGTAVTVQAMVFGNLNDQSGTGVLFTRNPDTGEAKVTGEWLPNAQGEDIVAGIRTPFPMDEMTTWNAAVHAELLGAVTTLETLKRDMQDVEWTVQDGKLYLLQTRSAKRSATAAIKVALDMATSGLLTKAEAVKRVTVEQFDLAQMASLDPKFTKTPAYTGLAACSGVVTGKPVFTKEDAIAATEPVILVREETTPEDIAGMFAAVGVVTMTGGMTCHAAVVARSMNRACIVGVGQSLEALKDIEVLSIDGATGRIWAEKVPIVGGQSNRLTAQFSQLVMDVLKTTPVIQSVPLVDLDSALLYLGAKVLDVPASVALVRETAKKVTRLYLDLSPSKGAAETEFLALCASYNGPQRVVDALAGFAELHEKLVVIGPVKTPFKMLGQAEDLRSIVLAAEEIAMAGLDLTDVAVKKVLDWKQSEGFALVSLGTHVPGSKSMISVQQALQLIAGVA
jgi:phosphohistidine swiveling domain-containing protein